MLGTKFDVPVQGDNIPESWFREENPSEGGKGGQNSLIYSIGEENPGQNVRGQNLKVTPTRDKSLVYIESR